MSIVKQILADLNKKDEKEGKKIVPKPKPKPKPKPYGVEEEYVPTEN